MNLTLWNWIVAQRRVSFSLVIYVQQAVSNACYNMLPQLVLDSGWTLVSWTVNAQQASIRPKVDRSYIVF